MTRRFGYAAGSATQAVKAPNLATSDGLIRHSREFGEVATLSAVAARGAQPNAPKQAVEIVTTTTGERVVALAADIDKVRSRPMTRAESRAHMANEAFLNETNPGRRERLNAAAALPIRRVNVGKRRLSKSRP